MKFKTGLYQLNEEANYNFQLNRLVNWDGGDLEEVKASAGEIKTNEDWKKQLICWGDKALAENRMENAIGYYRMTEFFMSDEDADKVTYYKKAVELFYSHYERYFSDKTVEKLSVPFEDTALPVLYAKSQAKKKGTILFHGGNDSYYEELFFPMLYFAENGYDVYLFEGPGQGGVLREQGRGFTHEWEKPVRAILDHFGLEDIILIGVSLGGMLAPRAAAFEKRVTRVVAWSVFPNFLDIALFDLPNFAKKVFRMLLKTGQRRIVNSIMYGEIKKDAFMQWVFGHGMYAYDAPTPYDYLKKLNDFQMLNVADRITQDILILHGKQDHFIDWRLYKEEIDSLTNAKSVTLRLFTEKENASNHCQCGNTKLALDTILHWLETVCVCGEECSPP